MDIEASARNHLERLLLDGSAEPTDLPLSLLKSITNNFSDDLQIGSGGFAVVYKGLLQNGMVAVKKLSKMLEIHERKYNEEVGCLMTVKHKNVVRFLGYCADTQGKACDFEGKIVLADVRQRLLCFEYLPQGSLDKYITDASCGLEWRTRYQIIKGISEGLHYLHDKKIVHLDLKPANILLDDNMVPKITDFGLSKRFGEKQSRVITSKLFGSMGYLAPEFSNGEITFMLDIYSFGIIATEILTGRRGYFQVENVLESWRRRLETSSVDTLLEHVRVCAVISLECIDSNPMKRPDTRRITEMLNELKSTEDSTTADQSTSSIVTHSKQPWQPILEKFEGKQFEGLASVDDKILKKVRNKEEAKVEPINKRNSGVEDQIKQLIVESQQRDKYKDSMINALKYNLEYLLAHQQIGGSVNLQLMPEDNRQRKDLRACMVCKSSDVCMLLLPCRHLCLCKECESKMNFCPLCLSSKMLGMEIFMPEDNRQMKDLTACMVCKSSDVCMLLLPCRHLCLCKACESKQSFCPMCESVKTATVEICM